MHRRRYRTSACVLALAALATTAGADEPKIGATMQCERASEPGRVKCALEARATGSRSIVWADVTLVELPDFAAALKGRIGADGTTARDPTSQRWAFALVARKPGQGEARARIRAVVCEPAAGGDAAAPRCAPVAIDVRAIVSVG
jgi:hypothetical protein